MARSAIVQDGNAWMQFSERWQNALESIELPSWACSSVGRAPALQAGGRGFESPHVHQQFHVARVAVWRRRHGNAASDDNLDPQQVGTDLLITALSGPEV